MVLLAAAAASSLAPYTGWARPPPVTIRMCARAPPELYRVYLLNDNFNMREYVQRVLMMVGDLSEQAATEVMMQANWRNGALVGEFEKPLAEHTYNGLIQAKLRAAIKPVEPVAAEPSDATDGDSAWFPDPEADEVRRLFPGGGLF